MFRHSYDRGWITLHAAAPLQSRNLKCVSNDDELSSDGWGRHFSQSSVSVVCNMLGRQTRNWHQSKGVSKHGVDAVPLLGCSTLGWRH